MSGFANTFSVFLPLFFDLSPIRGVRVFVCSQWSVLFPKNPWINVGVIFICLTILCFCKFSLNFAHKKPGKKQIPSSHSSLPPLSKHLSVLWLTATHSSSKNTICIFFMNSESKSLQRHKVRRQEICTRLKWKCITFFFTPHQDCLVTFN